MEFLSGWGGPDLQQVLHKRAQLQGNKAQTQRLLKTLVAGARNLGRESMAAMALRHTRASPPTLPSFGSGGIGCGGARDGGGGVSGVTLGAAQPCCDSLGDGGHVFVSYQWGSQKIVLRIVEALKRSGYRVWIDVEQMQGEMNKRMAEAVEGAAVVCPVLTSRYKGSANCMKELNYTDQRGCDILPICCDASTDRRDLLSGQVGAFVCVAAPMCVSSRQVSTCGMLPCELLRSHLLTTTLWCV